jgi:hypothetical protein
VFIVKVNHKEPAVVLCGYCGDCICRAAESPTTQAAQPLGSLQSVNLESMLRYTFVPDYTVRAVTDTYYIRIKRSFYLAAKRATLMERSKKEESNAGDNFEDEVEKVRQHGLLECAVRCL